MRYNNGKSVTQRTEKFFHDCVIDSAAHCIAIKTMELNSYLGGWAALCGEITDCVRLLLTKLISIVLSQIQGLHSLHFLPGQLLFVTHVGRSQLRKIICL